MSTIVKHRNTGQKYVLIGTGFGAYKAVAPSFFGGNLFPNEEEGTIAMVAVCDSNGDISWINSEYLQVVEIDEIKISQIDLSETFESENNLNISKDKLKSIEFCPTCGTKVNKKEQFCVGCGLKLFD